MISANITFQFCYAILLCCYLVFESYYSLSNSVIHFSEFIMPLWILLFSFQFYHSLSNYVLQFSIVQSSHAVSNPIISFQILLFSFPILLCIMHSFIQFPILLFAFELCSSKSGTLFIWPTVPWGPVTNWFPEFPRYRKTWRTWTSTPLRNRLRASINAILQ